MVKVRVDYIDRDNAFGCQYREVNEETVTTIGELKAYLAPMLSVPVDEMILCACNTLLLDDNKSLADVPIYDRFTGVRQIIMFRKLANDSPISIDLEVEYKGGNVSTENFYCDLSVSSNILIYDLKVRIWEAKNQRLDLHPEKQELVIKNNAMEDDLALREYITEITEKEIILNTNPTLQSANSSGYEADMSE